MSLLTAHPVSHPDDPGPVPPAWQEQEWCDEGATCEHYLCISYAYDVATSETLATADCDHLH